MKIKIKTRNIYGNLCHYPACELSERLIRLKRRKVFTEHDLKILKEMGYEIEVLPGYDKGEIGL